ncbi:DUF6046 domain-containing protein [Epilithonimonas xixisoli]|uniref:DUF6046 domain-containing protein n=1 Tax=Epilithonimonas xixisoli TaxID=1476462 RepID=A0A4R8IH55_9FLAO|nr:DUF6046 domain-containing protein [Epilithonimonas xixisoli]TDX86175.1 hypothetical protein B0I22_0285 [Epilithonimonas xixisoli]
MAITTANVFSLYDLYKEYFGRGSYYVDKNGDKKNFTQEVEFPGIKHNPNPRGTIHYSNKNISFNKIGAYGQDIWFPIILKGGKMNAGAYEGINIAIDACTINVNLATTVVSTPVVERKGTVNEIVNIDDYKFTIRGFLIGKNRTVPEDKIRALVDLKESTQEKTLHGGYPEIFLDESCRIIITALEFPEVQGQNHWIRPFSLTCQSDFITDLEF